MSIECDPNTLRIADLATGALVKCIKLAAGPRCLAVSARKDELAIGTDTGLILYDAQTLMPTKLLSQYHKITAVSYSDNSRMLAVGSYFVNRICLLDGATHACLATNSDEPKFTHGLSFSPDSNKLISGSNKGTFLVWSVPGLTRINELRDYRQKLSTAIFWSDSVVVSGSQEDGISFWSNITDVKKCWNHSIRFSAAVEVLALSPDGLHVASGAQQTIRIYHTASYANIVYTKCDGYVNSLYFADNDTLLACLREDDMVSISIHTKKIQVKYGKHYSFRCQVVAYELGMW